MKSPGKWILCLLALGLVYGTLGPAVGSSAQPPALNESAQPAQPQPPAVRPEPNGQPASVRQAAEVPPAPVSPVVTGRVPEAVPHRNDIIRSIQDSAVKIILGTEKEGAVSETQSSSGVVVYSETQPKPFSLLLTNAHAVEAKGLPEGTGVFVSYVAPTGRRLLRGEVVAHGNKDQVDLALVRLDGLALPAVKFEQMGKVELGSPVLVASSPFGRELSITSGIISQLYLSGPPQAEPPFCPPDSPPQLCRDPKPLEEIFKTDAPICYGSSGGGVFLASTGKLVGLVESYQSADVVIRPKPGEEYKIQIPVPGESFLISVNKIKLFLNQNGWDVGSGGHMASLAPTTPVAAQAAAEPPAQP